MKYLIIAFPFLMSLTGAFAQENKQTPFDKFIADPSITYGMYAVDTIRFPRFNLSALLRCRIDNKEIKASPALEYGYSSFDNITFQGIDKIDTLLFLAHLMPLYDENGLEIVNINSLRPPNMFDSNTQNLLDVTQIIYVEKGKIKTYIPFISPAFSVITAGGFYLGKSLYFTTSFNKKHNYRGKKKDKRISLGLTDLFIYADSVKSSRTIKQMYGNNLISAAGNEIFNHGTIYNYTTKNEITREEALKINLVKDLNIPVYNENGKPENFQLSKTPDKFIGIKLILDWSYNISRNIVTNSVKEIVLFTGREMPSGKIDLHPEIRIIY